MMDLTDLRNRAEGFHRNFLRECDICGYRDQWHAYRNEADWSARLIELHDKYIEALHKFYLARDGEKGVLGHI